MFQFLIAQDDRFLLGDGQERFRPRLVRELSGVGPQRLEITLGIAHLLCYRSEQHQPPFVLLQFGNFVAYLPDKVLELRLQVCADVRLLLELLGLFLKTLKFHDISTGVTEPVSQIIELAVDLPALVHFHLSALIPNFLFNLGGFASFLWGF